MTRKARAKTKNKGGRPCKLTPAITRQIVAAIAAGNYMEVAAQCAGISRATLYSWCEKGALPGAQYAEYRGFLDTVQKALADAEANDVRLIGKAAETQWQAAAWRLERKFPDRWGRKEALRIDASVGGKPDEPVEIAGGETVLALLQRLALPPAGGDK